MRHRLRQLSDNGPACCSKDKVRFLLRKQAEQLNDLTARAQAGNLAPTELRGGTFTISNLGPYGVEQFDALINPPEVAILAIGATKLKAVPSEDGSIRALRMMRMTLSVDHRIVDGAVAARFLADLKSVFETLLELDHVTATGAAWD